MDSRQHINQISIELFNLLKAAFDIGPTFDLRLNLERPDSDDNSLRDARNLAAFALRKVQALHYATVSGNRATSAIIVGGASDLQVAIEELAVRPEVGEGIALALAELGTRLSRAAATFAIQARNGGSSIPLS